MMRGHDSVDSGVPRCLGQAGVARTPCPILQVSRRCARRSHDANRQLQARGVVGDEPRLCGSFRPQPVIDVITSTGGRSRQRETRNIRAVVSGPPETASTKPLRPASGRNRLDASSVPASAAGAAFLVMDPVCERLRGLRIAPAEFCKRAASRSLFAECGKRHSKLQKGVRALGAIRRTFVDGQKRVRRIAVFALLQMTFSAEPELRVRHLRIVRERRQPSLERLFGEAVVAGENITVGEVVLSRAEPESAVVAGGAAGMPASC